MNILGRFLSRAFSFFVLSLLLISCGGGGGGGGDAVVPAPTITSFVSSATTISAGSSIDLTAVFAGGTGSIDNGVGSVTSGVAKSVSFALTTTYTLTVTNTAGTAVTATVTVTVGSLQSTVEPFYDNGINWNDYVVDLPTRSASDAVCDTDVHTSCLNGGLFLSMDVPGRTSCTGLSASDDLQAFEWDCDPNGLPVRFISTGFIQGKGLRDLIDFTSGVFWENQLTVLEGATNIAHSLPGAWWTNTIIKDNPASMDHGDFHIITVNTNAPYYINAKNRVAFVVETNLTLTANGAALPLLKADTCSLLWLEAKVDASTAGLGLPGGVVLSSTTHSVLRNTEAVNSGGAGIMLLASSNKNHLSNIVSRSNLFEGILLDGSDYNVLTDLTATENSNYGLRSNNSSNNTYGGTLTIQNNTPSDCSVTGIGTLPGIDDSCTPIP